MCESTVKPQPTISYSADNMRLNWQNCQASQ